MALGHPGQTTPKKVDEALLMVSAQIAAGLFAARATGDDEQIVRRAVRVGQLLITETERAHV